jgi:hypothetical protein
MSGFGWDKLKSAADWRFLGADQYGFEFGFWPCASATSKPIAGL